MPSLEHVVVMDENEISAEWLRFALDRESVLVLDCRSQNDFQNGHVQGSLNVNIPPLLQRRLKKGNLSLATIFSSCEMKKRFTAEFKHKDIVMYDSPALDLNANSSSVMALVHNRLVQEGCKVKVLVGGYSEFQALFPNYTTDALTQEEVSPVTVGLSSLSIVEPSTPIMSEATPSPSFPIQVIENLYLGNAKSSTDSTALERNNIKYILNVTPNLPNHFEGNTDVAITYKQIPINDHWSQNLSLYFPEAIAFINEGRSKGYGVLVHCLAGISRSVTITVAYLMSEGRMTLNDAYDYVKKIKPNISPNFNFMGQLLDFEQTLQLGSSSDSSNRSTSKTNCTCSSSTGSSDQTDSSCLCHSRSSKLFFMTPTKSAPNFDLEPVNVR